MPNILLEPISILMENNTNYDIWDFKKLKYFPLIDTSNIIVIDKKEEILNTSSSKRKMLLQSSSGVFHKLTLLEQLTTIKSENSTNDISVTYHSILHGTEININNTHQQQFRPYNNLKDFKMIQACGKDTRKNKGVCELDTFRFRFD